MYLISIVAQHRNNSFWETQWNTWYKSEFQYVCNVSRHEGMADLIALLDTLVDNKGRILIPGIYDSVAKLTEEEKKLYEPIDFDPVSDSHVAGRKFIGWMDQYILALDIDGLYTFTCIRKNPSYFLRCIFYNLIFLFLTQTEKNQQKNS